MEEDDIDILDITNPSKPKIVSETNLDQFAQTERDAGRTATRSSATTWSSSTSTAATSC